VTDLVADSVWPGLIGWTLLYVSDYALTVQGARLYRKYAQEKFVREGSYELTPYFQKDIDRLRAISPRFLFALAWGVLVLVFVWWMARRAGWEEVYVFVLGALVVSELAIHVRHVASLFTFHAARDDNAILGQIKYSRAFSLRMSSINMFAFAGMFAVVFAFTQSWFVLGGAARCLYLALEHRDLRRNHLLGAAKKTEAASGGSANA